MTYSQFKLLISFARADPALQDLAVCTYPADMGASVAQSVKCPDFSSGHDLTMPRFEPRVRLWADSSEPAACFRAGPGDSYLIVAGMEP